MGRLTGTKVKLRDRDATSAALASIVRMAEENVKMDGARPGSDLSVPDLSLSSLFAHTLSYPAQIFRQAVFH